MQLDKQHFTASHFELKWPLSIFLEELGRLLSGSGREWNDECELLLEEAFRYGEPKQEFQQCSSASTFSSFEDEHEPSRLEWLAALHHYAQYLPLPHARRPYWSQRQQGTPRAEKLDARETTRQIRDLIVGYEDNGYLAQAFGQDCVDSGHEIGSLGSAPEAELHRQLGRDDLWNIASQWHDYTVDDLCDIAEFIHDHVARPMKRFYHSYSGCGWHYSVFRREIAQRLYSAQVNAIFAESSLGLMLNGHGRFEEVATDALEPLIAGARADQDSGGNQHDELQQAIEQFRRRGASETEKRMAIVALAGVLEERRSTVKSSLLTKDEAVLFEIANKFGLRHRKANQQTDYDTELYFQWIFYWYISTIRLTDRILERQVNV